MRNIDIVIGAKDVYSRTLEMLKSSENIQYIYRQIGYQERIFRHGAVWNEIVRSQKALENVISPASLSTRMYQDILKLQESLPQASKIQEEFIRWCDSVKPNSTVDMFEYPDKKVPEMPPPENLTIKTNQRLAEIGENIESATHIMTNNTKSQNKDNRILIVLSALTLLATIISILR